MTEPAVPMPDRRLWLLGPDATFNGLDFAEVRHGQVDVHFINRVRVKGTLALDRPPVTLSVSGAVARPFVHPVDDSDWRTDTSGRPVLRVTADIPDAPARYTLTVHSDRVDPCFSSVSFSVQGRGDTVDPGEQAPPGPPPGDPAVPVDYLAKDFSSFLQALSNFSAARYPLWAERSEADFGIMIMELLSALADELSYLQDRVAAEAMIDTATQRLSLVRHSRLVDYEPAPALAASTVVQLDVAPPGPPGSPVLPEVINVQAIGGEAGTVDFAAGAPFAGQGVRLPLDARWNRYERGSTIPRLVPYLWDAAVTGLRRGATSMWIRGQGHGFYSGQELLIDTAGATGGDEPVREIVRVTQATERTDPVQGQPVTLIQWSDGLASDHELTRTEVAGNLLAAVHGRVTSEVFAIPGEALPRGIPRATVRLDHGSGTPHCLHTLARPLAWQRVPAADGGWPRPRPALTVQEVAPADPGRPDLAAGGGPAPWQWVPRLLDADGTARAFTVTPERYATAADVDGLSFTDYDGDGATIRFGDGTFGRPPVPGTTFRAQYLAGGGLAGNVAPDTIVTVAPGDPANGLVWRCTNPFAATGGTDAETLAQIRDRAPQQIRSGLRTLTGPADYQDTALSFSLDGPGGTYWARRAVSAVRWTGSWLSTVTLVDPATDESPGARLAGLAALAQRLNARRLAGSDTSVAIARYRWLDLRITCDVRRGHRPGDVEAAVLARLVPQPGAGGAGGFFGRDRWTFGQPLEASALIATVQSCPGVAGVTRVDFRRAGGPGDWRPLRATLDVAPAEILRIDHDADQPGHGLIFVTAEVTR
jgi:hypothetical protein